MVGSGELACGEIAVVWVLRRAASVPSSGNWSFLNAIFIYLKLAMEGLCEDYWGKVRNFL